MTQSIDGLVSGLDTTAIITQLMQVERAPQRNLQAKVSTAEAKIAAYRALSASFLSLQTAAAGLTTPSGWGVWRATSSQPGAVAAAASSSATGGSLTFTVDQLATAHTLVSSGTVSSTSAVVASGPLLVAAGTTPFGIASVTGDVGLATGAHTIAVVQSSGAATKTGTTALGPSTTITTGVDDTLQITVDANPIVLTLDAGVYDPAELADEVEAQSGGVLTASVDGTGALRLETVREGSAASIQVTGGSALGQLGLATDPSAITGTDATVEVDGNANTVSDVLAGAVVQLDDGVGGTIDATLAGAMRTGSVTVHNVDVGDGTLGAVVTRVNAAKAGVTATAVQTSPGVYRLQLGAAATGVDAALAIDPDALTTLGTLQTLVDAEDAQLTVGTGPAAYTVTSATNVVADVLPGVTLTLLDADPAETITVTVERDTQALAAKVSALVNAANAGIARIKELTRFDADNRAASVLTGDATVRDLSRRLYEAVLGAVGASPLGTPSVAGIHVNRDGTLSFDQAELLDAYESDPEAVTALFAQNGTPSHAKVSFLSATAGTLAGTYDVVVTTAAEQATVEGAVVGGGTITASETIDLRVAGETVSYTASAGESLTSIAGGLSAAAAGADLGVVATVEGGRIVVRTVAYGSGAEVEVRTSTVAAGQTGLATLADTWEPHQGVDVEGTIGGVAATGTGQLLSAPFDDVDLAGLSVLVTATPDEVALDNDFGTLAYEPGVAQRLESLGLAATAAGTGSLDIAASGREQEIRTLNATIERMEERLKLREASLRRQFLALETSLAQLQSQSNFLAGALAQLDAGATATQA